MPGDVVPTDWSADGRTILLFQLHRAGGGLYLYEQEPVGRQAPSCIGQRAHRIPTEGTRSSSATMPRRSWSDAEHAVE